MTAIGRRAFSSFVGGAPEKPSRVLKLDCPLTVAVHIPRKNQNQANSG